MLGSLHFETRQGTRPGTIVFIHGNSSSGRIFDPIFAASSLPYSLHRLDLPGHGQSPWADDPEAYGYGAICRTLISHLETIPGDLLLVGNSLGGHLVIDMATSLARTRGIVVFGSPPLRHPPNFAEAFLPAPELAHFFQETVTDEELDAIFRRACRPGTDVGPLQSDFRHTDPRCRSALAQSIANGQFPDEVATLGTLNLPKYLLLPEDDPTPNPAYLRSLEVGLQIIELTASGHYPSWENPAAFEQLITSMAQETFSTTHGR